MTSYGTGGSSLMMAKEDIRTESRKLRDSVTQEQQKLASESLIRHFLRLRYGICWLLYAPIKNEISTDPLFKLAHDRRKDRVYYPRVKGDQMTFHLVNGLNELSPGSLCPEPPAYAEAWDPNQPSVIIVPGLAFSARGDRLGFGKGFYDRFLSEHPHLPRLAIGYDFQIFQKNWQKDQTDQPVDYVITPSAVWGSPRVVN